MFKIILFLNLFCFSANASNNYDEAFDKAKEAAYVQSGAKELVDKTGEYLKKEYVDKYDWTKKIAMVGGGGWFIYKHRQIRFPLGPSCKLTLATDSLGIEYHW